LDYISHFGIKGQKWGVRRYQNEDGTYTAAGKKRYSKRQAKKDAEEYARAKMFYGEGAGTRRKLIKATVEERSKDPEYKKNFDAYLAEQDMAKHAQKAKTERKVKDTTNAVKKTGRGVVNIVTGHPERVGAGLAVAAGTYSWMHQNGIDTMIYNNAKTAISKLGQSAASRRAAQEFVNRGWTVV